MEYPASIWKQAEQNPQRKQETFSDLVIAYMKQRGMSAAELAERSSLSKATITRMTRNTDYRGHPYCPNYPDILKVSIALQIGMEGYQRLLEAAYPQARELEALLECGDVLQADIWLDERGLPLLSEK